MEQSLAQGLLDHAVHPAADQDEDIPLTDELKAKIIQAAEILTQKSGFVPDKED